MDTQVSVNLTCPCNGHTFKNAAGLARHEKTAKEHHVWVAANERKDALIRSKNFENEIERLKLKLEHKELVEKQLLARIAFLEEQLYL